MKSRWKTYLLYASLIILGVSLLFILTETVRAKNTGFETKTLWDWMELLIIPFVLAVGAFVLNRSERAIERENAEKRAELERELAKDHQQEEALQVYLDRMTELLLNENLRTTKKIEVRNVARIRTLTILGWLDPDRKMQVLRFLYEANLIKRSKTIVNLSDANFINAYLQDIILHNAELSHANFYCADLTNSDLSGANLSNANLAKVELPNARLSNACLDGASLAEAEVTGAFLEGVTLKGASCCKTYFCNSDLSNADLSNATMTDADLSGANLIGANLAGAYFAGANFTDAKVSPEQLAKADSLKGAILPDGTIHSKVDDDYTLGKLISRR